MAERFKGNVSVRLIARNSQWRRQGGWTTVLTYHGLHEDIEIAKNTAAYVNGASEFHTTRSPGASDAHLIVTFAAQSQDDAIAVDDPDIIEFSNDWTFGVNRGEVDPWRLPQYRALEDVKLGYTERIRQAVERYRQIVQDGIAAGSSDKDKEFVLTDYITPDGTTDQQAHAAQLAKILVSGQDSADRDRHVLRNVRTVPGNTSNVIDHFKTGFMWSNDKLVQVIAASDATITQRNIVGDIDSEFVSTRWLKAPPETNALTNGRFEIISEWTNYAEDDPEVQNAFLYG